MSTLDVYEIEDDFDPLEDLDLGEVDEDEQPHDYLPPIPDAELSNVPPEVVLSPAERFDKLIVGMPGHKHRILHALGLCREPRSFDSIVEELDRAYPHSVSIYEAPQIISLLERAEVIERVTPEGSESAQAASDESQMDLDYISVTPPPPLEYVVTSDGLDALERYLGKDRIAAMLDEEPLYLPLYRRILEMTSREGGCPTKELDAVIDHDPLCENPKRFGTYFLHRLEDVGAVQWGDAWHATDEGVKVLESDLSLSEKRS